jgi:hypothetical protein
MMGPSPIPLAERGRLHSIRGDLNRLVGRHPTAGEWSELRCSKLPDVHAPLTSRVALDTLYRLLADAVFAKEQELLDAEIVTRRHAVAA